jgi:hypothetical protein
MVRVGISPFLLAVTLAFTLSVPLSAQEVSAGRGEGRPVPPAVSPKPFSIDATSRHSASSTEFRPADQMTPADRLLAADAESSIAEHAGLNGFEFEQGSWSYRQVVCPALPHHLFLQYTRNNGAGDVTVFSASIPRGGEGRIRIIPILRRSYSLFSPAPINALTISAFNHIRAEEPARESSDWLGNGLCYAALAGAQIRIASSDAEPGRKPVPALGPVLWVARNGEETIEFADAAATPHPMQWTMTFNPKGKLVKARHAPAPMFTAKPLPKTSAVNKTWSVPSGERNKP